MPQADGLYLIKTYLNIAEILSPFLTENISKKRFPDYISLTTLTRSFLIFAKLLLLEISPFSSCLKEHSQV